MLHWVIQNNLYEERGYDILFDTVERFELEHTYVKVVPFSHELIPAVTVEGPKVVLGSITLGKLADQLGWSPGSYSNENFYYPKWRDAYGSDLLSPDLTVCRFGDVAGEGDIFIRPCLDDKSFPGAVLSEKMFSNWQHRVLSLGEVYTTLDEDTEVCYGEPKKIYWEGRFFVVGGKVVTQSQYKLGWRVVTCEDVPPAALKFAKRMVSKWQPSIAFVIDIADTPEGYKVIEIGGITSAGFYASDVQRTMLAIQELES